MTRTPPAERETVVDVDDLRKSYGSKTAVDGISLSIQAGEIFGIAGPNGAGKTTLVECLTGLRKPDSGTVEVLGLDPHRHRRALLQEVGVQLQESSLPDALRVGEALRLYSSFYTDPADWRQLMREWGLEDKKNTPFGDLSGGWKQRAQIALALIGGPRLAVLDELTSALDPYARRGTWDLVREMRDRGVTVVLVSHFMDETEYLCDRVAVVNDGRVLASGTPAQLKAESGQDSLDETFVRLIKETR